MSFFSRDPFLQPTSLLDLLTKHNWRPSRRLPRGEFSGLCPLHLESQPSFYVNVHKQVFYCHGCKRGGGFAKLKACLEDVPHSPLPDTNSADLLEQTYCFYQQQLDRFQDARLYLHHRGIVDPAVIERMRIGYAPGACLRGYLLRRGYSRLTLLERGLVNLRGYDRFFRCLTFPIPEAGNLYGRATDPSPWRHQFLRGSKGGLYGFEQARHFPTLIVVEGLFDVAALWQAGFPQAVAALGSHLNPTQVDQLSQLSHRSVYVCFDADRNGSGQRAAHSLARYLHRCGIEALRIQLPCGSDPAAWFAAGASSCDFQRLLERARP